ncbi:carcinoembryonic antigen-related cell adhesion molecule 20-like [Esox lucius]|uniref:carcinoembryonic antigen-related cell adhesion molecule 20-like n=1 Tax=Esox lucius TaxID=8010 RepID=UPI001476AD49|nr:carcinoembryonic antigen-related cell adhesion molecule 20-like [Esox lucius]
MAFNFKTFYTVLVLTLTGTWSYKSNAGGHALPGISYTGRVTAGYETTFTCISANCVPQCTYTWVLKGRTLNGNTLTWTPDGLDRIVELQCTAVNSESGSSKSTVTILEVTNPVSVRPSPTLSLPILNQSFSLECTGSSPGLPVLWYQDGQTVAPDVRLGLLKHNTSLHFNSLLLSDGGFYQCEATMANLAQSKVISLGYLLSFDHWNVTISGPDTVFPGRKYTFTCETTCNIGVDCSIRWPLRGSILTSTYFSVSRNILKWIPSVTGTVQNITCVVENTAFGRSAEFTKTVKVTGSVVSGSDRVRLSGVVALILCVGLLFLLHS